MSTGLLDLPEVPRDVVAEHLDARSLALMQDHFNFLEEGRLKLAMQKKLEQSCLAAIKEPTGYDFIVNSNFVCKEHGYEARQKLDKACREKTKICSKIHHQDDSFDYERVNILPGTIMIGIEAFKNFEVLKEIIIPNTVTNIGYRAFYKCTSLKRVVLPESVKIIQKEAFEWCIELEELVIPKDIEHIGEFAFHGCLKLNLIFQNNVPHLNRDESRNIGTDKMKQLTFRIDFSDPGLFPFEITEVPIQTWATGVKIAIEPAI